MKSRIIICSGLIVLIVCLSASFGLLTDEKRMQNQNMFGGYGEIHSTGNFTQHFYYDDTNFYYQAAVPTWGNSFFELYAYDFEAGESYRVCKRISCLHKTADCPIHPCYQGDMISPSGVWNLVDNKFISLRNSNDKVHIRLWDPLTDTYNSVVEIPRYQFRYSTHGKEPLHL